MSKTILLVEGNEANRSILRNLLQPEYSLMYADNGQDAIALLMREYRFITAVLLSITPPSVDGLDVLEKMQKNPVLSQIPVVVISGSTDKAAEKRALALGATDYITKPFDQEIILRRIHNFIRLRETSSITNTFQRDRLTGMWNREAFFEKAEWNIKRKPDGYFVLCCMDIDNFKIINDQYGTEKGDSVLRNLAMKIQADCDAHGGICGRISADNFVVLYPRSAVDSGAVDISADSVSEGEGLPFPITLSIGFYVIDDKSLKVSAMYDRAHIAQAAVKGRYDVHVSKYGEDMRRTLLARQEIVGSMNSALTSGQFEAWFQPQYNHSTGALIGAEALARWRHPVRGMISPNDFIPIFERNGFIYELDRYIWEQALIYLRKWTDEGRDPLPVSVNISRYDLFRSNLASTFTELLDKYGLPAELLRLEITESAFAESTKQVVKIVRELIDRGFTVEIDDFGSGYSSLNTLKDVPAHIIKLDMHFLENSDNSGRGGNILESVVRMSKWLGMAVIAEGVEDENQAEFLQSIGCYYMQGNYYSMPLPASEYEALAGSMRKEEKLTVAGPVSDAGGDSLWNSDSIDTLIFNSYIGAACVFEYSSGVCEILRANAKFARMLGRDVSLEQAMALPWACSIDAQSAEERARTIRLAIDSPGIEYSDVTVFHDLLCDGRDIHILSSLRVIAAAGDRYLIFCASDNITAQCAAEEKERETSDLLRAIMNNMRGGVSAATMDGARANYIFANDRFYAMLGYTREQYDSELKNGLEDIIFPEDMPRTNETVRKNESSGGSTTVEYRVRKRDGSVMWMRADGTVCRIEGIDKPVHIALHTDITAEKEMERRLRLADFDGMTGVYNKTATEELIAGSLARGSGACALLIGDIDNLKTINDTLGHIQGDIAIKRVATLLHSQFRQTDIVGRIGGDEFAVFVSDITEKRIRDTLVAFMRRLSSVRIGERGDFPVHSSIGVAVGTHGADTYRELFSRADKALYHVKRNGRDNFAFYTPDMENAAYVYESRYEGSKWQTSLFDADELDDLVRAVSTLYPIIISANLTQNSYYMLHQDGFSAFRPANAGEFDKLIASAAETYHPEDREGFLRTFSRKSLIAMCGRAESPVSYTGRQAGYDGEYRSIRTDVIFTKRDDSDDITGISLSREC